MVIKAADALFTTTQQRVLRLLFDAPETTFIQQEVIDATGSGSGAVQRELARLVGSGLLTVTILGRQKHYQANRSSVIFAELRAIVAKTMVRASGRKRSKPVDRIAERPVERPREPRAERRETPPADSGWQLIFD